jgi:hypothetical protein
MELNIKINLDNAAYQKEDLAWEIRKNLEYISSDVALGLTKGIVRETNGNTTGHWEITA